MNSGVPVVLVTGRDPRQYDCSHTRYVRTHARAALSAGYDVHVVCLAREPRTETTEYGTVHAAAAAPALVRQNRIPLHSRPLARRVAELARALGRRHAILHGFGVWGHAVARAHEALAPAGVRCARLLGSYTTYLDESRSQWRGLTRESGLGARAKFALEQAWIRAVVGRYERRAYRDAAPVLVNYRSVQRLIEARFGADVCCQIIPYTIEQEYLSGPPSPRQRLSDARRAPRIVSVARHDPRKGVDVLVRALHLLKQQGAPFSAQLVGDGLLLEAHRRLVTALGLADCVEVLGRVANVDDYLAGADVFVLPSREEQSGSLALLEAMRAGVACVASGCDGIPEDVRHGTDAWLTAPGDARSLAAGLEELIANPGLRLMLAREGRRTFESRFSSAAFTRALDRVYQDALAEIGARRETASAAA